MCPPVARNAGRRGLYAAQQAAKRAAAEPVSLDPGAAAGAAAGPAVPDPPGPPTIAQARRLAERAEGLVRDGGPLLQHDYPTGQKIPTPHGLAAEAAVRDAGQAVARIIDSRYVPTAAQIDARWAAQTGAPDHDAYIARLDAAVGAAKADYKTASDTADRDVNKAMADGRISRDDEGRLTLEARVLAVQLRAPATEAYAAGHAAANAARQAKDGNSPWAAELAVARAEAVREVLAEIRPMGPTGPLSVHKKSGKAETQVLNDAARYLPTAWAEQSDRHKNPLLVRATKARAHYQHGHSMKLPPSKEWQESRETLFYGQTDTPEKKAASLQGRPGIRNVRASRALDRDGQPAYWKNGTEMHEVTWEREATVTTTEHVAKLTIDKEPVAGRPAGWATALHEMSHRVESTGDGTLGEIEHAFIARRATLPGQTAPPPTEKIYPHQKGPTAEKGLPDELVHAYAGRVYQNTTNREVLSMGVEAVYAGKFGGLRGRDGNRADSEHEHLVLGMLSSL